MCSSTFRFEYKFWFQIEFRIAAKLSKTSNSFSWEQIFFFTKVDSDFRETISWLALFFLCRGILSLLVIEGLCRKYPENTFLMSKCFSSNLFWWRDIRFWLENVYLVCGHWHRIPSFSPESNVFWISAIFLWVLALFVVSANYSKPDGTLIKTFWL